MKKVLAVVAVLVGCAISISILGGIFVVPMPAPMPAKEAM